MRLQAFTPGDQPNTNNAEETSAAPATHPTTCPAPPKKRRGFAAMDRAAVRAIAHKGGVAAHERGTAHRFTTEEAREAGRKGGCAPHKTRGRRIDHVDAALATDNVSPSP